MLKFFQAELQQYVNQNLQKYMIDLENAEELEIKLPISLDHRKSIYFCFVDYTKAFDCVDHNCGKIFKRWEDQTTLPASWEMCMQVRKQQLELDMEQQTDSISGKEYVKDIYCHPAYVTYMQSSS